MHWLRNVIGTPVQTLGVASVDEYRKRAKAYLVKHGQPPVLRERVETPTAYVSDGRWVCACGCGGGCAAHPEWAEAICLECGSVYRPVFPVARLAGEAALLARPSPMQRHWLPGDDVARLHGLDRAESVLTLARENRRRGLPAVKRSDDDGVD